jgi:YggT family protein
MMTIRRQDEDNADGSGQRTAVVDDPPVAGDNGTRQTAANDQQFIADDQQRRTTVADPPIARDESVVEEQVVHSSAGGWNLARGWVRSLGAVILVALAVVETLLVGRLVFLLAEANANNGFVNFIYDVTKPLVEPFQGIVANTGNLEYASVIAMVVYAVAALLLIAVLFAITAGPSAGGDKVVTSRTNARSSS